MKKTVSLLLCVLLLIGSAAVKTVAGQLVTPRGYRNV